MYQNRNYHLLGILVPYKSLNTADNATKIPNPSPYEIKNGIRFIRGTNKLVSESLKIRATDIFIPNNTSVFSSISECSIALKLDRSKIKTCLLSGEIYKNYRFTVQTEG